MIILGAFITLVLVILKFVHVLPYDWIIVFLPLLFGILINALMGFSWTQFPWRK